MNIDQQNIFITRYLTPYVELLNENLTEINAIEHVEILLQLISIITQSREHYTSQSQNLIIADGTTEPDVALLNSVRVILQTANEEEQISTYEILYKLLHEIRWNKSPDPVDLHEKNAQTTARFIDDLEDLYEHMITEIGPISKRIMAQCNAKNITAKEIEDTFLENILGIALVTVEEKIDEYMATPVEKVEDESLNLYINQSLPFRQFLSFSTECDRLSNGKNISNEEYWNQLDSKKQNELKSSYLSSMENVNYKSATHYWW